MVVNHATLHNVCWILLANCPSLATGTVRGEPYAEHLRKELHHQDTLRRSVAWNPPKFDSEHPVWFETKKHIQPLKMCPNAKICMQKELAFFHPNNLCIIAS